MTLEQAQNLAREMGKDIRETLPLGLAGEMMLFRILDALSKAADSTDSVDDWLWWDRGASYVSWHIQREKAIRNGQVSRG